MKIGMLCNEIKLIFSCLRDICIKSIISGSLANKGFSCNMSSYSVEFPIGPCCVEKGALLIREKLHDRGRRSHGKRW
jgi:hypothetical protein